MAIILVRLDLLSKRTGLGLVKTPSHLDRVFVWGSRKRAIPSDRLPGMNFTDAYRVQGRAG